MTIIRWSCCPVCTYHTIRTGRTGTSSNRSFHLPTHFLTIITFSRYSRRKSNRVKNRDLFEVKHTSQRRPHEIKSKLTTNTLQPKAKSIMASFSLLLIASCLTLLRGSIEATCECRNVCSSYRDVWKISSKCPAEGLQKCMKPHIALPTCHDWGKADEGGCV